MKARSRVAPILALFAVACQTTTQCDCVAPTAVVFGNVSGTTARVAVEVRTARGDCAGASIPAGLTGAGWTDGQGNYEAVTYLNAREGPECIVVTAETSEAPFLSVTKQVSVMLQTFDAANLQRIRIDVAFGQ